MLGKPSKDGHEAGYSVIFPNGAAVALADMAIAIARLAPKAAKALILAIDMRCPSCLHPCAATPAQALSGCCPQQSPPWRPATFMTAN
jgi:hypothetical protein